MVEIRQACGNRMDFRGLPERRHALWHVVK